MIPAFQISGVLPPFIGDGPGEELHKMSPYPTTMLELVKRFGISEERRVILIGLMEYRKALHDAGIVLGFHWLDGSFVEDIEGTAKRPPNDIDIVTFFYRPVSADKWKQWSIKNRDLFDSTKMKTKYKCDSFGVDMNILPSAVVSQTRYWFGLFSHRRATGLWKGMLQLDLDIGLDSEALSVLKELDYD